MKKNVFTGTVLHGDKLGRTIGFPTINLDVNLVTKEVLKKGVYKAEVEVKQKKYVGALYYGPRLVLNEIRDVLEIHLLDFDQEIYGEKVKFIIQNFIRGIIKFNSFEELKNQLQIDVKMCSNSED